MTIKLTDWGTGNLTHDLIDQYSIILRKELLTQDEFRILQIATKLALNAIDTLKKIETE